jgi:biopolymer transport protein TolR
MMRRRRFDDDTMAQINITPFTDVVLVLLIIFMIATPIIVGSGIKIHLPKAQTSKPEDGRFITVSIDAQKNVYLDGRKVSISDLSRLVRERVEQQPGLVVKVNGDKTIQYNIIVQVLDVARQAGVARYLLVAERPKPGIDGGK